MAYNIYADASAYGDDADDEDGSSDLVDNLKKQAIEEVKTRAESAQGVLATDPKLWATVGSGALAGVGIVPASGDAGGLSAFSGQLAEVWSSPLANEIGTSIDSAITATRALMDDVYEKANNAWWSEEDQVPKGSDEASSKWK